MGLPKTIFHCWEQHILAAQAVIQNTGLNSSSVSLLSLPMHHVGGLAIWIRAWVSQGHWLMPPKVWTPSWAREQGVTHMSLVSTQLMRWMRDPESVKALRSMKAILLGGSAIPKTLIEQALAQELPIITTYGSTETASQVTATRLGDSLDRLLTSGRCLADRELRIENGEIMLRGAMICQSGWYATGDLGFLDTQGYLNIFGRRDNRLISGGENIYPEEIEAALLEHFQVESALVVAIPDAEYGQRPAVFVRTQARFADLEAFLKERILKFKVPKTWFLWPEDCLEDKKPNRLFFAKKAAEQIF